MKESNRVKIEIIPSDPRYIPRKSHETDACFDCFARVSGGKCYPFHHEDRAVIPLGFTVNLPPGYEMQIRPRSGLALRKGVHVHFGTVDCGYKDEVGAIIINLAGAFGKYFRVKDGDRICQMLVNKLTDYDIVPTQEFSPLSEDRGGGYGSTGR